MVRLFFILILFALTGCAHMRPFSKPVKIRLVPKVGGIERTRYRSRSVTETYAGGELQRKRSENVEFAVETRVVAVDPIKNKIQLQMKTVEQDGAANLHDFAMPELDEVIEFIMDDQSRVYSAGKYAPGSIFYVPPLPLPPEPVRTGDTWEMEAEWATFQGVPLRMELVSIMKGALDCGPTRCADIEISGSVSILGADPKKMRFRSLLSGRYLFSLDRGAVLWSLVRSEQQISTPNDRVETRNCMISRLEAPQEILWEKIVANECEPTDSIPEKLEDALKLRIET